MNRQAPGSARAFRTRRQGGYSLLEVMIAVLCLMASFAWTLSLVNTSVRANEDGWDQTVASQFAATWMERIKRDATRWNEQGVPFATTYLNNPTWTWFVPEPVLASESVGADAYGQDTAVAANMRYCVNLRVGNAHQVGGAVNALVVGVKVFWHRSARGNADIVDRTTGPFAGGCAAALTQAEEEGGLIRTVEFYNVVHWVRP
jgi:Tfp pilus assembly protein PilV